MHLNATKLMRTVMAWKCLNAMALQKGNITLSKGTYDISVLTSHYVWYPPLLGLSLTPLKVIMTDCVVKPLNPQININLHIGV